jgi:transglutaminase-like putative cysteine protease
MTSSVPSSMTARWRPGPPLLGLLAGWVALFSWSGMVTKASDFLMPTLFVGLLMALAGSGLRMLRVAPYAVAAVQLVIALLSLNVVFDAGLSRLGVIPTWESVREVMRVISSGAATLNTYSAPVEVNPTDTEALLMACGLAVLLSIDVLAMGLRKPPLIALPLLVTLSVPVSILHGSIALPVFVGTALLFLRLVATEHIDRFHSWAGESRTVGEPVHGTLWSISIVAVVAALLAAPFIPVADLLDDTPGARGPGGAGTGYHLTSVNPFIRLRRDLVEKTHTPLVYADTKARSTSYLRTTVLDRFTDDEWRPSPRTLPSDNRADGVFPDPPGLAPGVGGAEDAWKFEFAPNFSSLWLPLPYPVRELNIEGSWRYDARTLDVAFIGGGQPQGLKYSAISFTPSVTAELLESAKRQPPTRIQAPMTAVPDILPDVIRTRARQVTRGAEGDFAKAVALQDWFRTSGGFRYSLEQRSGSGMDLLAAFVTNDRVGYCEQFAAAMAAMGRVLGIPSRVVVGFLDGSTQDDGRFLYTSDDRHAWPEMYFTGVGWVRFEPTPGSRAGATPSWTRQSAENPTPTDGPSDAASEQSAPKPKDTAVDTQADGDQFLPIPAWPLTALLVLLGLGLAPALVRAVLRRRRLSSADPVHLAEGAWAELRATALDLGLDWPERRSPREQARRVVDQVPAEDGDLKSLEGLLVRVERGRYGPARRPDAAVDTLDPELRSRTVDTVDSWRRAMAGSVQRERDWRGRIWPMSLVRRRGNRGGQ